jgi:hypothetical protein
LLAKNPHQLACKDNQLVRQSSLPADWFATLNDPIDDLNSQIPFMTSSPDQESLSGGISEETGAAAGVSGKSSMYSSQDDSFLFSDTTTTSGADGGLWNSPTSPGTTQLLLHFSFFQVQNLSNSAVYCILHLS